MNQYKRVTETEYQKRMDVMMALRARGIPTSQLVSIACQQWGISERQAMRYLKAAKEQENSLAQLPASAQYAHLLLQYNYIYQQAIQLENLELAMRVAEKREHLIAQQQKELRNDPTHTTRSHLVGSDELEMLIQSLEKEGQNHSE